MPPLVGAEPPVKPEPAPLGYTGTFSLFANFNTSTTSSVDSGKTTASGTEPAPVGVASKE